MRCAPPPAYAPSGPQPVVLQQHSGGDHTVSQTRSRQVVVPASVVLGCPVHRVQAPEPRPRRAGRGRPRRRVLARSPTPCSGTASAGVLLNGHRRRRPLTYANLRYPESCSESLRFPWPTGRSRSWISAGGWVASTAVNGSRILYVCRACRGTTHALPGSRRTIWPSLCGGQQITGVPVPGPDGPRRTGQSATSSSEELVSRRGGCSGCLLCCERICERNAARLPRWGEMRGDGWDGRIDRDVRV